MSTVDVLVVLQVTVETDDDDQETAQARAVEQARICADQATSPGVIVGHVSHIHTRVKAVAVMTA